jgi:hypothetical protein
MESKTVKENRPFRMIENFGTRKEFVFYVICLVITVGTMAAVIITSLKPGENQIEKMVEHVSLCVGALLFLSIPPIMHKKYNFNIPWFINITIAFMILAHFVLGEIHQFYNNIPHFDKFLHLTGGFVIAACGFSIVYGFSRGENGYMKLSPLFAGIFSFCFALTLLVLWEILEYLIDSIGGYNMQRWKDSLLAGSAVGQPHEFAEIYIDGVKHWYTSTTFGKQGSGLIDTMNDLIIGTIGAAVVSILGGLWFKKNPDPWNAKFLIRRQNIELQHKD